MEEYLSHHGILGQKWGIRRFQNEDGTLTDAGRKHYNIHKEAKKKSREVADQGDLILKNNERMRRDFGNDFKTSVDDYEFFRMLADDYGIDLTNFDKAWTDEKEFYRDNAQSIDIGARIARKLLHEKVDFYH